MPRISACCDARRYHGGMSLRPAVEPESVLDNRQRTRYSRQILLHGEDGQARLAAARVLVVGAGGLGSPALLYLAAAGVGTIGIVDDDVVDLSNLHRQVIHDSTAIATPKAVSAAAKIEALNPDVDVIVYPERLTEENAAQLMSGYDVVLDGSDNFFTRYAVDAACSELSIPEVWGSILRYSAQISVFWTGGRARQFGVKEPGVCLRDLFPSPPPAGATSSCGEAGVIGSLCGQVGSTMAGEAVKLITGVGEPLLGTVLALDALSNRYETIRLLGRRDRPEPLKGERLMSACGVPSPSERGMPGPNVSGANVPGSRLTESGARWLRESEPDAFETWVPGVGAPKVREPEFDPSETWVPGADVPGAGATGFDPSETLVPGADGTKAREPEFDPSETWVPGAGEPRASKPEFDASETLTPEPDDVDSDAPQVRAPQPNMPEPDASGLPVPEKNTPEVRAPEAGVARPKPRRAQSRGAVQPESSTARFRRGTVESKPGAAQSWPSVTAPEADALQNRPGATQTKPGAIQTKPGAGAPKPSAARPSGHDAGVPEANVREVAVRLAQGAKMLDVRESHERAICAIRPSTHIPLADVLADPSAAAKRLPDGPVYVYCLGGVRSMQAAKALAAEGVEVINVAGGLKQWWLYVDPSMPRY